MPSRTRNDVSDCDGRAETSRRINLQPRPSDMRKKRALPAARRSENNGVVSGDVNGRQIHRLGADPRLQTLTPRSLAKNVAELEALRSRVLELEQQLSKHDIEALTPSKPTKKLPPLGNALSTTNGGNTELPVVGLQAACAAGIRSTDELKPYIGCVGGTTLSNRVATAPAATSWNTAIVSLEQGHLMTSCASVHDSTATDKEKKPGVAETREPIHATMDEPEVTGSTHRSSPIVLSNCDISQHSSEIHTSGTTSPPREQTKIVIGQDGETAIVAVSQRNRLYQILKRVSTLVNIKEDELVLLKKLVDAEIGDVIKFLVEMETERSVTVIQERLAALIKEGSPSKHRSRVRPELPGQHPVWSIHYPLLKVAQNLEHLRNTSSMDSDFAMSLSSPSKKPEVIVLVSSGAYNPIHMLHIRAFYVARQYVESNYKFPVVGAFISPSHDTYVRVKNRRNPREMITKRHRLALIEAAVASSSWIEVDKWEITRRRVLDYLSTLSHAREMCETHFPQYRFHVIYVCGCNTVVKLSHSALREEGFGCITVCRPTQTAMVIKHLGKTLAKTTTIVEDTGVLPCDLERATSYRVRQALTDATANASTIEMMVGKPVFQYFMKHDIGSKIAGKENWSDDDKQWRDDDLAYVAYTES